MLWGIEPNTSELLPRCSDLPVLPILICYNLRFVYPDAFDREFKNMFEELPPYEKARMRLADRSPSSSAVCFRRLFGDLEL